MKEMLSIIIPCRNGVNYLAEAVDGINSQNMHTEIIVIDDGSNDETSKLAARLGCAIHSTPPIGQAHAKNIGLSLAKGEFVLFHDHDDVLRPGALPPLLKKLIEDTSLAGIMAQAKDFVSPELEEANAASLVPRQEPYYGFLGATLLRKQIFELCGNFAEEHMAGDTVDMLMRIQEAGLSILREPIIVMNRRLHLSNVGRSGKRKIVQLKEYAASLRQLRERERENSRR